MFLPSIIAFILALFGGHQPPVHPPHPQPPPVEVGIPKPEKPKPPKPPKLGDIPKVLSTIPEIRNAEDAYFQVNRKYLQIIAGDSLPSYEPGTVAQRLGSDVATTTKVDIYQMPDGRWGYQITQVSAQAITSVGFGPEFADRTFITIVPLPVASSTEL